MPNLEECKPTSLALPCDCDIWQDVQQTFTIGKLDKDIGGKQFNEMLPRIPDNLLKREQDTKELVAATLNHQSYLEILMSNYANSDIFMALAKNHLAIFIRTFYYFCLARKACREYVLQGATVRHEPRRLIDSNIWGKDLFPEELVKEIVGRAASENISLTRKWGIYGKRKFTPGSGPQPKGKRSRSATRQRKVYDQRVAPAPQLTTVPSQMLVPQLVTTSPAFNPVYEQAGTTTFRPHGSRGRGGRGGRGQRGSRSRGRGYSRRGDRGAGRGNKQ